MGDTGLYGTWPWIV